MTISITVAGVTDTLRPEHEKTTLDMPREELFFKHWNNFEEIAYRNKNTSLGEKIAILTPHIDIIHYAMKDSGPVTGRDFVTTRINRHVDGDIIEAARSYNTDEVERYKKKIRQSDQGNLLLGGARFRIHPNDPEKTIVDHIICLDLNGPNLAKPVVEYALSKFILQDAKYVREAIENLKTNVCTKTKS